MLRFEWSEIAKMRDTFRNSGQLCICESTELHALRRKGHGVAEGQGGVRQRLANSDRETERALPVTEKRNTALKGEIEQMSEQIHDMTLDGENLGRE